MKFSWLDEQDKDIRWFLKTWPAVAPIFILFFGFILYMTINDQAVSMRDGHSPIHFDIEYFTFKDNPIFFVSVVLFESAIVILSSAYIIIRLKIRARIYREDAEKC